jgi:hypothetical protein
MAPLGELNSVCTYYWEKTATGSPVDIVNKASATLWKLMGNAVTRDNWEVKPHELVDGGLMVKVPLEIATSNSGSYGAVTVINQSKKTIIDSARFRWAGAYGSNTLNLTDKIQNAGSEAIIDLSKQYLESIKKSIRTNMASQLIGVAANDDSILGLGDLFNISAAGVEGATSVEYGSLTEAGVADWCTGVITTAEAISFEVLQKVWREPNMGDIESNLPNWVVTTATLRDGYERSLHPQQRYQDNKAVEAGWQNILHKGAPIVADSYVASGRLYALNLNYLSLRSHSDFNFTTPVWLDKGVLGQPDIVSANTRWVGNLFCSNRKMQVLHTALTEPV